MKPYLAIFKNRFIGSMQYRVSALAGLLTQVCFGFMYVFLYTAFYEMGNVPENFTYDQMITYLWLQQAMFAYFGLFMHDKTITSSVVDGNISYELIRPINLYNKWYATLFSSRIAMTIMRMIPLVIIAFCLPQPYKMSLPASWGAFGLFIAEVVVAGFLVIGLSMLCYVLLFKTMTPNGTFAIFTTIGSFCSGALMPLPLMPETVQKVLNFLPFRYLNDLCFRTYVGSIDLKSSAIQLCIQLAWAVGIIALGKFLMHRNLKKVEVQGG